MTWEHFLDRLGGVVRESPTQAKALCPCHPEKTPSLSVRLKGRAILVHCFGCGAGGPEVADALDLTMGDLFCDRDDGAGPAGPRRDLAPPANGRGADPPHAAPRIVATYDYVDEGGVLLYQNVRMLPKKFFQRRPHPDRPGEWVHGLGRGWYGRQPRGHWKAIDAAVPDPAVSPGAGALWLEAQRRVLFKLVDLAAAMRAARKAGQPRRAGYCEGEKDCLAAWAAGVPATTNTAGTKSFAGWGAEYVEQLQWAGVEELVVIPHDDDTGRGLAQDVVEAVHP